MDDATHRALRSALAAGPPLRLAIAFGSVARGTARAGSDLDVAVAPMADDLSLAELGRLAAALGRACRREVDVVLLDEVDDALAWRIARDGVCLVSTPSTAFARWRAEVAIRHADWVEMRGDALDRFRRSIVAGRGG